MKALKCLWIALLLLPLAGCSSDGTGDESGGVVGYTHPLGAGVPCDPDGVDQCHVWAGAVSPPLDSPP